MSENENVFEEGELLGSEGNRINQCDDDEMEGPQSHEDDDDEDSPRGPLSRVSTQF